MRVGNICQEKNMYDRKNRNNGCSFCFYKHFFICNALECLQMGKDANKKDKEGETQGYFLKYNFILSFR